MKLSKAQEQDLETIKYFTPQYLSGYPLTKKDIEMFFEHSEKGMHKDLFTSYQALEDCSNGLFALIQGKIWRGTHMGMYEEGVLSGDMPYAVILGMNDKSKVRHWSIRWFYKLIGKETSIFYHSPPPRSVVDFMKKEMFKGHDANTIERCYQRILSNE